MLISNCNSTHARLEAFFGQSIFPMKIYDAHGSALEANQAWIDLFQTTRDSLDAQDLLTDPTIEKLGMKSFILKALKGTPTEMPAIYLEPKMDQPAQGRWMEAFFAPVKNDAGEVIELAIILKDSTDHNVSKEVIKRLTLESQIAQERLSLAVKVGKIGIWDWKVGDEKVYWDETLEAHYGYAPGTFSGLLEDYSRAVHPEDVGEMWAAINEAREQKKSFVTEHRIIRPNGEIRWLLGSGTTTYDSDGNPVRMMGTSIDVTDKKTAILDQTFISELSDILASSFDFLGNLQKVVEYSSKYFCDGCFISLDLPNTEFRKCIVATTNEKIKEQLLSIDVDHPVLMASPDGLSDETLSGLTKTQIYSTLGGKLKGRELNLGAITFFNHRAGQRFTDRQKWLAREVTYRISNAIENSLLYINSQKAIRSRDEFLSIASHELKTPLTSLTLQNQMRKRMIDKDDPKLTDKARMRKMVEVDEHQFRRINRLVDDMLDITRILSGRLQIHKETFEFTAFIGDIIDAYKSQFTEAGCDLIINLCQQIMVEADAHRLEQVVVNLITNAMKYAPGRPVKVEVSATETEVSLLIQDGGPGIEAKDAERIFERFERGEHTRNIGGLGLGLYISRQIMNQHNGNILVKSGKDQGSSFVVKFPR